ncbi:hypothetical protein I4U23_020137 [Adineta vaga]|nr:hypothetical protein I4U23_020137 [Adineta vaga]
MNHDKQKFNFALDQWPVELILMIFQYLSGRDIFFSFYNTSVYLNQILKSYNHYSLNFLAITKEKFDEILSFIDLNQIIALTLSNEEFTGGQFNYFLSNYFLSYHLFSNLYSLTLHSIKITNNEYYQFVQALKQWKNLRILHLIQIHLADIDDRFTLAFHQLDQQCLVKLDHCEQLNIIPLSNRLHSWKSSCLYDIDNSFYRQQWPCLRTVKLTNLWRTSINHLFDLTPRLHSLTVECEIDKNTSPPNFRLVLDLRELIFSCQNLIFDSFIKSTGLDQLSKLNHLEIRCNTSNDEIILNGFHWEEFLSKTYLYLLKFDFYFKYFQQRDLSLTTFRTPFWLEQKQWFVASSHCPYSNNLELFTVPRFNTTMKMSRSILETTSNSFSYLNSHIHTFDYGSLVDKNNNDEHSLILHRYEHIETFEFVVQNKFDSTLYLVNRLNCLLDLNSIKTVKFDVLRGWIVNYQQIFDLLDHMPNLSKVILDTWPKKDSWLQIKQQNSRVTFIELPSIHKVNDNRLPSGLKPIFTHLFSSIKHVYLRVHYPELCYQLDRYSLPWNHLSSLQIKYFFTCDINEDQDEEQRYNQWKEILLNETLPQEVQRNFTYTDVDNKLCLWFGEKITIEQHERIEEISGGKLQKKPISCCPYRKCLLS